MGNKQWFTGLPRLAFSPDFQKMRFYQTRHFDKKFKYALFGVGSIINQGLDGKI